ncbi:MAG: PEGA domain-containing protein [Spirochaetales bacterium]|nr:PEGA domain-containing protein [Spirochaetales bacterium]
MKKIPYNPYIVGNPIKTKEMFFGREDDFQYVIRKIGGGHSNQVLIFCGDRRSGKTSILFQIRLGRLGGEFLPILIDMQILAGIKNDTDFFKAILDVACSQLSIPGLTIDTIKNTAPEKKTESLFTAFLDLVRERYPEKIVLFLLDEYELIETKIKDGTFSESVIHFLSGILESPYKVSFIFTGSTNLENRKVDFWKSLLGKSIYRKISYFSENDTARLITDPLKDYIDYPEDVIGSIYRLTGGQPFYTQVICQNIVDLLIEEERNDVSPEDLKTVIKDIVNNPLPQMIYSWNNLGDYIRLILSALSGVLKGPAAVAGTQEIYAYLMKNKIQLPFKKERINILLEDAYHMEFLKKNDRQEYSFRMDIFRRWIKKEHSIWKVTKEIGLGLKRPVNPVIVGLIASVPVIGIILFWVFILSGANLKGPEATGIAEGNGQDIRTGVEAGSEVNDIVFRSNYGPFRVVIDEALTLSSEGGDDVLTIVYPVMTAGDHTFQFIYPKTGEKINMATLVNTDNQAIEVSFKKESGAAGQENKQTPRTVQKAAIGSIIISSTPPGADIIVNGEKTDLKTPNVLSGLDPGTYTVELKLKGHRTVSKEVAVDKEAPITVEMDLERISGFIVLRIRPTALVYFEDTSVIEFEEKVAHPVETPRVKPLRVEAGTQQLKIENESLKISETVTVTVEEGKTLTIDWDLTKKQPPEILKE